MLQRYDKTGYNGILRFGAGGISFTVHLLAPEIERTPDGSVAVEYPVEGVHVRTETYELFVYGDSVGEDRAFREDPRLVDGDAGIGKDVSGYLAGDQRQPALMVTARETEAEKADEFLRIIRETTASIVRDGVNKRSIEAALNRAEFSYREADFGGYPKGIIFGFTGLTRAGSSTSFART